MTKVNCRVNAQTAIEVLVSRSTKHLFMGIFYWDTIARYALAAMTVSVPDVSPASMGVVHVGKCPLSWIACYSYTTCTNHMSRSEFDGLNHIQCFETKS